METVNTQLGRRFTIPFRGTVTANSSLVLVSQQIDAPFRTLHFSLRFELNTNRTVEAHFIVANDANADAAIVALQNDLFAQLAQHSGFVGDDQDIDLDHNVDIPTSNSFLKILIDNNDGFPHEIDAQITIELFSRGVFPEFPF